MTMKEEKTVIVRKKIVISILAGFLSLLFAKCSVSLDRIYGIHLIWSLVFALLTGMAFEWQYSLLTVVCGTMWIPMAGGINPSGLFSVCLGVCFSLWILFNGIFIRKEDLRKPLLVYMKELIYGGISSILLSVLPSHIPGVTYNRFILPGVTLRLNVLNYLFTILMLTSVVFLLFETDICKKHLLLQNTESEIFVYRYLGMMILSCLLFFAFDTFMDNSYSASKGLHLSFVKAGTGGSIKITILCFMAAIICKGVIVTKRNQMAYEKEIESWNKMLEAQIDERTRELKNAYDDLESYSYTVSHELKSPLREIEAYVEIIEEDNFETLRPESLDDLQSVKDVCRETINLIQEMMDYAKAGYAILNPEKIDMSALITDCVKELKKANPDRRIDFRMNKIEAVVGDQFLIRQAVYNILSNAVKFTVKREQAVIEICSYKKKGTVCFSFADNGVGFDPDRADKLFDVFGRLHSEMDYEGKGVGLATVKKIISRHGGSVSIRGSLDKGCEVYFELPDAAGTEESSPFPGT
ncbi:MAG: GHKL domain-containing protein [Lachnospiraceae bacterium]|nr:GHKL domain-containing protein [Lachnospiraceae bacterium]